MFGLGLLTAPALPVFLPVCCRGRNTGPKSHAVRGPVGHMASWCAMCEAATDAGVQVARGVDEIQAEKARTTRVIPCAAEKGQRPQFTTNSAFLAGRAFWAHRLPPS